MTQNENLENSSSKNKKINVSILIAVIALLVSSISAIVGIRETQIMADQQKIYIEQKEASVWPYLEHAPFNNYENDYVAIYEYLVTNKGVGPAIIDSVRYVFEGEKIHGWQLDEKLQEKYPNLVIIGLSNIMLDNSVLAPGEKHSVIKVKISNEEKNEIDLGTVLNGLRFHLEYCYCSIYGKCWKVSNSYTTTVSDECQINENIR